MPELLVNIDVPDLDRAIAFYEAAIGLRLRRRLFEGSVAEMDGYAATIYLLQRNAGSLSSAASPVTRTYARHWTPVHLDIAVDDLDAAIAKALAAGARKEGETGHAAWGSIAHFADPFGHGFCLLQFTAAGYDAVA